MQHLRELGLLYYGAHPFQYCHGKQFYVLSENVYFQDTIKNNLKLFMKLSQKYTNLQNVLCPTDSWHSITNIVSFVFSFVNIRG
jgi:hypothetical protein